LAELQPKMKRHAHVMQSLTDAVVSMDNREVARLARTLVADPDLAQPLSATLRGLPPEFRDLEDAFQQQTRALAGAADAGDDKAVAETHSALALTCARCHAAFRR
jgi:hypothetical protein